MYGEAHALIKAHTPQLSQIGLPMARVTVPIVTDDITGEVLRKSDAVRIEVSREGQLFTLDLSEASWLKLRDALPEAAVEALQLQASPARGKRENVGGRPKGRSSLFASKAAKLAAGGQKRVVAVENVSLSYYKKKIPMAAAHGLRMELEATHRRGSNTYGRVLLSPL
jgi:hypothetical protein